MEENQLSKNRVNSLIKAHELRVKLNDIQYLRLDFDTMSTKALKRIANEMKNKLYNQPCVVCGRSDG